ncbi:hypothetical protein ACSIGC_03740 [Tenacibaculum sp. ZS6-P6]|uniref:hypothetical protein n=1 Tax=Tenacibaculum sp. ZS6-P6 TaxID=3447503 RepID=UPI003F99BEA9
MMEKQNYIEEKTLPLTINFEELKGMALAYIQKNNDNTWTNLNPSDPGVTILDQLCYAFTELGYCNYFPMKDILTNKNKELEIRNQFYLPEDILTTTPVTINDIRKYVVDQVKEVINLQITPIKEDSNYIEGKYKVEVLIDSRINKNEEAKTSLIKEEKAEGKIITKEQLILNHTFFVLNTCRNLGELFCYPKSLQSKKQRVYGTLELAEDHDLDTVIVAIEFAINNYVFPEILEVGYDKLKKEGKTTDEIFNGPNLKNGWIADETLCPKKNKIQAFELAEVIQKVPGVLSISNVAFNRLGTELEVFSRPEEILTFDFIQCVEKSSNYLDDELEENAEINSLYNFKIYRKDRQLNKSINSNLLQELSNLNQPIEQISKVSTIQMYPELPKGNYRDIESYFSIQNTFPEVYAVGVAGVSDNATDFQKAQSRQLKGYLTLFDQVFTNQFMQLGNLGRLFSFDNSITGDPKDKAQFYSVQTFNEEKYQKYPAPYLCFSPTYFYQSLYKEVPHIKPLLKNIKKHEFTFDVFETEKKKQNAWEEYQYDPYNSYIHGLMLFMEDEHENIKRRNKILNHLLARHGESPEIIDTIIEGNVYSGNTQKDKVIVKSLYLQNLGLLSYYQPKAYNYIGSNFLSTEIITVPEKFQKKYKKLQEKWLQGNQKDFIFRTVEINKTQQIKKPFFTNYSGVELKLNLLFSLPVFYENYLIQNEDSCTYWLYKFRKGLLCIEANLIIESLTNQLDKNENQIDYLEKYKWVIDEFLDNRNCLLFIFPSFFIEENINSTEKNQFKIPDFKKRLSYFLEGELPVQIIYQILYAKGKELEAVIIAYANWHNSLRFDEQTGKLHGPDLVVHTIELMLALLSLTKSKKL